MDEGLIRHFLPVTEEEKAILRGEKLDLNAYRLGMDARLESHVLLPRDRLIAIRPHTRFTPFPMHSHDYVEGMYVLSGCITHQLPSGERLTLEAGELLFINRFAAHGILPCGEKDVAVNFIMQTAFFDVALDMVGAEHALGQFLLESLRSGEGSLPYLHFRVAQDARIQHLLQSMLWGFILDGGREKRSRIEMGLLFSCLMEAGDCMAAVDSRKDRGQLRWQLLAAIEQDYAHFRLDALAEKWGVSSAYLSRIVRDMTGRSVTDLLQSRRLEKARQLLLETDMSVLSISHQVGYENSSYFYRLFRQRYGLSPHALRCHSAPSLDNIE